MVEYATQANETFHARRRLIGACAFICSYSLYCEQQFKIKVNDFVETLI
jgi:hypothetical protein